MLNIASVLCFTLLHSLWQAGLLYGIYMLSVRFSANPSPLTKRNVLYGLITIQWLISILTFCLLSLNGYPNLLSGLISIPHSAFPLDKLIISIYTIIVLIKLMKLLFGLNLKQQHEIISEKIPVNLRLFSSLKLQELGVKRKVKIAFAKNISGPLTYGILKPLILFPVGYFNHLNTKEAEMILLHELVHIRYHDYLLNIYLIISELLFFFNPFMRWMGNDIRLERERNCDVWVLQFKYNGLEYAEALYKTAALSKKYKLVLAAVNSKNELMKRIESFTRQDRTSSTGNFRFFVYAGALVLLLLCATLMERTAPLPLNNVAMKMIPNPFMVKHLEKNPPVTQTKAPNNLEVADKSMPKQQSTDIAVQKKAKVVVTEVMEEIEQEDNISVSLVNNESLPYKEVTVTETNPATGESVTQSFRFIYYQNEWIVVPSWQLETLQSTDSLPSTPVEFSPIQ